MARQSLRIRVPFSRLPEIAGVAASALLYVADVAAELRVSTDTVRRWIRLGRLPAVRVGGAYRVRREVLERVGAEGLPSAPHA